jgi:hypothetical protein
MYVFVIAVYLFIVFFFSGDRVSPEKNCIIARFSGNSAITKQNK